METMAIEQGHTGLQFTNKQVTELDISDGIAGVDHGNTCMCQNDQNDSTKDQESNSNDVDCTPETETSDDKSEEDEDEQHEEDIKEEMETLLENDNCNGRMEDDEEKRQHR